MNENIKGPAIERPAPLEKDRLVRFFEDHHRSIEPQAVDLLLSTSSPLDISLAVIEGSPENGPITQTLVSRYLPGSATPEAGLSYELIKDGYVGQNRKVSPGEAYHELFADRYSRMLRILKGKPSLRNLMPVKEMIHHPGEEISLVGMVKDVRVTEKARHIILTLDDPSGEASVLVLKDSTPGKETFLNDEVIGVKVWIPKDGRIAIVKEVLRPDVPTSRAARRSSRASKVLFLSDLHVGSKMFLNESWNQLVAFLQGETEHSEMAMQIRHIVVAGDLVDGIGIYPGQERDLAITDIVEQYKELGRLLSQFPKRQNIVVIPGNHDAVCPAEPQPALSSVFSSLLPSNVRTAGNPSLFALDGVMVQAYHGRGFDNIIPNIPGARYEKPTEVMKHMLAMRHLSPAFGETLPLAPLSHDGLMIDSVPDIFVTGHTHTSGVECYRGVTLINASAWISETDYQRMRNVKPVPSHGFVVDLSTHGVANVDFTVS